MSKPKSKIEHVRAALELLKSAGTELIDASADFGTPTEIQDARTLTRHAARALEDLLERLERSS